MHNSSILYNIDKSNNVRILHTLIIQKVGIICEMHVLFLDRCAYFDMFTIGHISELLIVGSRLSFSQLIQMASSGNRIPIR